MQRIDWIAVRLAALSAVSFAIGVFVRSELDRAADARLGVVFRRQDEFALRRVTSEDLVGAEGQCRFAGAEKPPRCGCGPRRPGNGGAGSRRGRAADDRVRRGAARGRS